MKSSCGCPLEACCAFCRMDRARARTESRVTLICTKLLGNVFLNNSRASSSFRILMVSARATSSSDRILQISAHSFLFVAQFLSRSARNFLSSISPSCESVRSFFIVDLNPELGDARQLILNHLGEGG